MPFNVAVVEAKALQAPAVSTAVGYTGSWVDCQGLIFDGSFKVVLHVGVGTTAGTASASIQSASDTSGTGLATETTFTEITAAGGMEEKHFTPTANNRYMRLLRDVQTGKDMIMGAVLYGAARVKP